MLTMGMLDESQYCFYAVMVVILISPSLSGSEESNNPGDEDY